MSATDSLPFPGLDQGPDFEIENRFYRNGEEAVAGVDEAGRGPLAGPVVAAAVILDPDNIPTGLNDSKKLTERSRELLFDEIIMTSHTSWASLPAALIDTINIREAALTAMTFAITKLPVTANVALIDGRDVPTGLTNTGRAYVKGDARSLSISAASIVAKVIRDKMMMQAAQTWPQYGFEKHKGYGSKLHRDAIEKHGPCPLHRMTFSPMKTMALQNKKGA
ncbi:MAG: ribonuclease HII [Pseudomonadota bacterium]